MKTFAVLIAGLLILQASYSVSGNEPGDISVEEQQQPSPEIPATGLQLAHEIVNEQSDQPSSGEQFVAFHKDVTLGAKEELSPTLLGINNMAMKHLPTHLKLLSVISVYREIVAGVKYELLVNAIQENGERIVCHLQVLERPWIVNQWGEKWRNLQYSNCSGDTQDQLASVTETYHVNPVFNPNPEPMTEERIRELEDQILRGNRKRVENPNQPPTSSTGQPDQDPPVPLAGGVREELDKFFRTQQMATRQQVATNEAGVVQTEAPKQVDVVMAVPAQPQPGGANGDSNRNQYATVESANQDKVVEKQQPDVVQISPEEDEDNNQQVIVPVFDNVAPQQGNDAEKVATTEEDKKRRRRRQSLSSVLGIDEREEVEETLDCADKPFQFKKSGCPSTHRVKRHTRKAGGLRELPVDDPEIKSVVDIALVKLADSSEKAQGLKLVSIDKAHVQVVAGKLYHINVTLQTDQEPEKKCHLRVWYQLWISEDPIEVNGECENDEEQYQHKRVPEPVKDGLRRRRSLKYNFRPLPQDLRNSRDFAEGQEILYSFLFDKFQAKFARNYSTTEERNIRFRIFKTNMATIAQLNRHEMGTAKYGVTEFADLSPAEFKKHTGLLNAHHNQRLHGNHVGNPMAEIPNIKLPREFDWRDKNAVSGVKNQGQCGSCWAFSVIGNIEGLNAIKTGKLDEFSEQELVDCDTLDAGCNGGLPDNAYKAIEQIGGLEYETEYPYEASKKTCHFNKTMSHVRVTGAVDLPKDEKQMAQWLVQNGPISIGLNAAAMQFYHGGVSHPYHILCRPSKIDHGVLIVGFGQSDYPALNKTLPYWIVKNSWGPSWGERGYYRIYRGDNSCGLNTMASSAVLA